jgi:hypothetical protein
MSGTQRVDWDEYERRLALREQTRRDAERAAGWSDAPGRAALRRMPSQAAQEQRGTESRPREFR